MGCYIYKTPTKHRSNGHRKRKQVIISGPEFHKPPKPAKKKVGKIVNSRGRTKRQRRHV